MTNVFIFDSFRGYLKYYFEEKRVDNPQFSYRLFMNTTGFSGRLLGSVINGSRQLSTPNALKLSNALNHSRNEKDFFIALVCYTQAKTDEEREYFRTRMFAEGYKQNIPIRQIGSDHYEFYSRWYHSAIRSFIGILPFKGDFKGLGQMFSPPISEKEVENSICLLERLGLITRNENEYYRITDKCIATGDEITDAVKNRLHEEFLELAKKALSNGAPENRKAVSVTLGISGGTFDDIRNETESFIRKICILANGDKRADRVYQYQLLLFPLSDAVPLSDNKKD